MPGPASGSVRGHRVYSEAKRDSWKGKNLGQTYKESNQKGRQEAKEDFSGGRDHQASRESKRVLSQTENMGAEGCCTQSQCVCLGVAVGVSVPHTTELGVLQINSILTPSTRK